eukprot:2334271-Amphidinium_carterae.1
MVLLRILERHYVVIVSDTTFGLIAFPTITKFSTEFRKAPYDHKYHKYHAQCSLHFLWFSPTSRGVGAGTEADLSVADLQLIFKIFDRDGSGAVDAFEFMRS